MASKKRGLSLDDKRAKLLEVFHESRDVFVLKDIEKLGVKKGIVLQSIKEVLQSLVDDDMAKMEKIGSANYYWSFPSEASVKVETALKAAQESLANIKRQKQDTQTAIDSSRQGKEISEAYTVKMGQLQEIKKQLAECDDELTKYKDNDPETFKSMCKAAKAGKLAANRWLDNIDSLRGWCKKTFVGHEEALSNFFTENGATEDMEYLECS